MAHRRGAVPQPRGFELAETIFAPSNGCLGLRGTFDEGRPVSSPGAFVNGFHETWPILYPEAFNHALLMDLGDAAGNTSDGAHIASAAGVWLALVEGFGGVRDFDGRLSLDPRLPRTWTSLAFSLRFRDRQLRVTLAHDEERYALDEGDPLEVTIRGTPRQLAREAPLALAPAPAPG